MNWNNVGGSLGIIPALEKYGGLVLALEYKINEDKTRAF
jgi:hypothetical protein